MTDRNALIQRLREVLGSFEYDAAGGVCQQPTDAQEEVTWLCAENERLERERERLEHVHAEDHAAIKRQFAIIITLERELAKWKERALINETRRVEAAKTATDALQEVSQCRVDIKNLERYAGPFTEADEPPWPDWFSCEDCNGWFTVASAIVFDSGRTICAGCEGERKIDELERKNHELREALDKYGRHKSECDAHKAARLPFEHPGAPFVIGTPCTCGLDRARRLLKEGTKDE